MTTETGVGTLLLVKQYCLEDLQDCPEITVIFGDNLNGTGLGGQAKECRPGPNSLGIPTKKWPSTDEDAYFSDADAEIVTGIWKKAFDRVIVKLKTGGTVA